MYSMNTQRTTRAVVANFVVETPSIRRRRRESSLAQHISSLSLSLLDFCTHKATLLDGGMGVFCCTRSVSSSVPLSLSRVREAGGRRTRLWLAVESGGHQPLIKGVGSGSPNCRGGSTQRERDRETEPR